MEGGLGWDPGTHMKDLDDASESGLQLGLSIYAHLITEQAN